MLKAFYRRQLPHLQCDDKQHFVTFCTDHRWILPERVRSIVLECCRHDNGEKSDQRISVVMPDHVHMIFTPLVNREAIEVYSLAESWMPSKVLRVTRSIERWDGRDGFGNPNRLIMYCALRKTSTRR